MKNAILFCSVLLFCSAAAADDPPLPPYRAVVIATIDDSGFYNGGIPWFPGSKQRFQLAGSGDGTLIAGSTTFVRDHDFGGLTGIVTEYLSRGRYWHRVSGSWVGTPLLDEGEESERVASVACDINADGVVVGAICEPVYDSPSETWRFRPAYWLPDGPDHTPYFFDQPEDTCISEELLGGVAYGVGPGEAPLVAGSAFTLCGSGLPEAFGASLADAPSSAPMVPLNRDHFICAEEEPEGIVLSEALAVVPDTGSDPVAVGFDFAYDPQTFEEPAAPCIVPLSFCDIYSQVSVRALTWWLPTPPTANNPGPVIAEGVDWRFRAFDGAAGPEAGELPAWSIAGGHSLDETTTGTCHLHATAYMGYLPDTEEYGTISGQGLSFDVHAAILDDGDPPNGEGEDRIASAIGAICHAEAGNTAVTDVEYLAAGARFGSDTHSTYGVIWLGARDGEGGWQWCGRRADDPDVTWLQHDGDAITAVHDILPSGIAVAIANQSGSKKLVLLTSLCDINGDFAVDGTDLGLLLGGWGSYTPGGTYRVGDLNRDGVVDGFDLGAVLGAWSSGPVPVYMGCAAKLWLPISPIEVEGASRLLGFEGLQDLGEHLTELSAEDASNLGEYVSNVAQIMHQD